VRDAFRRGKRRVCVTLPTGAGKTAIATAIIETVKGRCYFVVPRLELAGQTSQTLGMILHGFCMAGRDTDPDPILVCSIETLRRRLSIMPEPKLIFFDEAHTNYDAQMEILNHWPEAFVIGLTATPELQSGAPLKRMCADCCPGACDLIRAGKLREAAACLETGVVTAKTYTGIYDELYNAESISGLQAAGYLAKLNYLSFEKRQWVGRAGVNEVTDEKEIEKNVVMGDIVKEWEKYGAGSPSLGFTPTIALAEKCVKFFADAGYPNWAVIHGGMPLEKRQELIGKLKRNELNLVNAALLTYGFDAPPVRYAFSIRHIFSRPLWVQMVGRILRPAEGKTEAIFVDHGGSVYNFDEQGKYGPGKQYAIFFDDPAPVWNFEGNKNKRCQFDAQIYCQRTKPRPPCLWNARKQCGCPEFWGREDCRRMEREPMRLCYYTPGKGNCAGPRCDELEVVDAKMVSLNKSEAWAVARDILETLDDGRDENVRRLCVIAQGQGYKPYWVLHFINDNAGLKPHDLYIVAKFYGYKSGWAWHKAQEFGIN